MKPNTKTPSSLPLFAVTAFFLVPAAYTGFACLSSPCVYGICLDDLNSSFTCYCMDGYTGTLCQTNWDDCWSSPCENGGTCTDGVASFNCSCPEGFTGDLCELNVNECLSNPCLNNATCLDGNNGYFCVCEPGYNGQRCEQDMAVCNVTSDGEPRCHNGGLCREGPGEAFYCDCAPGWTGKICDDPIDECASNPCQHGGVCIDLHNAFACACLFGYTGNDCSLVLEPCRSNVCENGALCLLEGGDRQHVCYCVPDFHGPRCQYRYDECLAGPGCRNGGSCIDGIDEYSCTCPPQLSGNRCECLNTTTGDLDCSYEAPSTISTFPWTYSTGTAHETTSIDTERSTTPESFITTVTTYASSLSESIKPETSTVEGSSLSSDARSTDTYSPVTDRPEVWESSTTPSLETTDRPANVSVFLWTTQPSFPVTEVSMFSSSTEQFSTLLPPDVSTFEMSRGTDRISTDVGSVTIPDGFSPGIEISTQQVSTEIPQIPFEVTTTESSLLSTDGSQKPSVGSNTSEAVTFSPVTTSKTVMSTVPDTPTVNTQEMSPTAITPEVPVTSELPPSQVPASPSEFTTEPIPLPTYETSTMQPEVPPQKTTSKDLTPWIERNITSGPESRSSPDEDQSSTPGLPSTKTDVITLVTEQEVTVAVPGKPVTQGQITKSTPTTLSPATFSTTSTKTTSPSVSTQYPPKNISSVTTLIDVGTLMPETHVSGEKTTLTYESSLVTVSTNTTTKTTTKTPSYSSTSTTTTTATTSTVESSKTQPTTTPSDVSSETIWPLIPSESPGWMNGTDMPFTGDCPEVTCRNGSCVDGIRCVCNFGWTGISCDRRLAIRTPAFNGHSFLAHLLPNSSVATGLSLGFVAKTLSSNGLLVHATLSHDVYMSAYLEDGLLRFQFSCGVQTMLFNELQRRVDDGRELVVNMSLTVRPVIALQNSTNSSAKSLRVNARVCAATLRVNHTLAMSGEQTAILSRFSKESSAGLLLLGGLPFGGGRAASLIEPLPDPPLPGGFSGCMRDLQVNGQPRHVYEDAIDGSEIAECSDLACLSSPCHGGATCAQSSEGWTCLCPPGMVGRQCERSVCLNNPCQFGGTCVTFPGSGFLCLCPLGKRGMFCEYDLEITTPKFSPIGGLSSYASYVVPTSIDWNMELRIRFLPTHVDQVALLLFIGQTGQHGPLSDHLALSYIQGHVLLTWNLGSGVRRIYTRRPVPRPASGRPHYVRIGRVGRVAWLKVDGMENITGESLAPLDRLNVRPVLYVGGHGSINFSQLPHDLPLHQGFHGCVASIELLIGNNRIPLVGSSGSSETSSGAPATYAVAGRAVGQCETTVCSPKSCEHGICLQHGPAFVCVCQDGWFGPTCTDRQNPCDEERNACSEGSTCVPTPNGYECDCRLGRSGRYCEQEEQLSDVFLSGRRSFLEVAAVDIQRSPLCLQMEIRPSATDGLLLLVGHPFPEAPYLSLALRKSVLVATLSSARSWPLVIRSTRVVGNHAVWHLVRLCRSGRLLTLTVDGTDTKALLRPGDRLPSQGAPLFIGGLPDMSALPAVVGEYPFKGCVRRLSQNNRALPLDIQHLVDARNVADCDGTRCGGDVCFNGGTCSLRKEQSDSTAVCQCTQEYTGSRCETQLRCPHLTCKNGGRCVQRLGEQGECQCPLQWTGPLCGHRSSLGAPLHFPGNAYLLVRSDDTSARQRKTRGHENDIIEPEGKIPLGFISLNYSTTSEDGMILWTRENDQWVGVGLRQNNLTVLWGWREKESVDVSDSLEIEAPTDGTWVSVTVQLGPDRVAIWRDGNSTASRQNSSTAPFSFLSQEPSGPLASRPTPVRQLATDGTFFIGGFPGNETISSSTKGLFTTSFVGCIASLHWNGTSVLSDLSAAEGENIESCHNLQFWDWNR